MHTKCSKHSLILMVALSVRAAFISQMPVGSMEKKISCVKAEVGVYEDVTELFLCPRP